jgi:hypothetical protein
VEKYSLYFSGLLGRIKATMKLILFTITGLKSVGYDYVIIN